MKRMRGGKRGNEMSRYIDADEFERTLMFSEEIYEALDEDALLVVIGKLSDAPTIDIVFCKECIHCADDYIDVGMGTMPQFTCEMGVGGDIVSPDDFCSYGERKEGE